MRRELLVTQLEQLVCAVGTGWPAAEACCRALRATEGPLVGATSVPKRDLQRIYEIRLSRNQASGPPVVGAERILSDLESYAGEELTILALPKGQNVYCLFLNDTASELVTCFVARDRRDIPTGR